MILATYWTMQILQLKNNNTIKIMNSTDTIFNSNKYINVTKTIKGWLTIDQTIMILTSKNEIGVIDMTE